MLNETLHLLATGRGKEVAAYYEKAKAKWDEMLGRVALNDADTISERLDDNQIAYFEHECGGRSLGQEIMVIAGFYRYYDPRKGEDKEALRAIAAAFQMSSCSLEIKSMARSLSKHFELDEPDWNEIQEDDD